MCLQEKQNVLISRGKIIDVFPSEQPVSHHVKETIEGYGNLLVPGFIDLQVNGGGGVFFNDNPSIEGLKVIAQAHLSHGTTSFLPTFISDSFSQLKKSLQAVEQSLQERLPGVLGIHLEGPFLNGEKKGIHEASHIRLPKMEEIEALCQAQISIKCMTLAPEVVQEAHLKKLVHHQIHVFAGHTQATFQQMQDSVKMGVKGITHFFNACSPLTSREPGVVGYGLWDESLWCGLIADGYHVNFDTIRLALKGTSKHRFFLVSDAMAPVGFACESEESEMRSNTFHIHGQKINITQTGYRDDRGTLAGSSLTMHQAVKNMLRENCASLEDVLRMASLYPAQCLHLDQRKGKILPHYDADLLLLNKDTLDLIHVVQNGERVL